MVYGTIDQLRKLSGGITSTTLPDDNMTGFLKYGSQMIEACSGLKDVPSTDARYDLLVQGALYYASSAVRDHLKDIDGMADVHYDRGKTICESIVKYNISGTSASQITSVSQGYKSYPLNPEGEIYTLKGFQKISEETEF